MFHRCRTIWKLAFSLDRIDNQILAANLYSLLPDVSSIRNLFPRPAISVQLLFQGRGKTRESAIWYVRGPTGDESFKVAVPPLRSVQRTPEAQDVSVERHSAMFSRLVTPETDVSDGVRQCSDEPKTSALPKTNDFSGLMQIETNRSLHCFHEAREDRLHDLFSELCPRHRRVLGLPNLAWGKKKGPGAGGRLAYCSKLQSK